MTGMYGTDYPQPFDPGPDDNPTVDDGDDLMRGQVRMAHRLAARYGDRLLHVHGIGWHHWDGKRWRADESGRAKHAVVTLLKTSLREALWDKQLQGDVNRCQSDAAINGVLNIAAVLPEFACTVKEVDADPYLLNVANGTLDLRSLTLQPHDPKDRITKVTLGAYDPNALGPLWDSFLKRVLPDEEEREFLRRYTGTALCGRVIEHNLAILNGGGRNGKGTFYRTMKDVLGDYAGQADPELFMHREGAHPTGEMDLRGRRFVVVSESERDRRLAEATVKRLTGGDPIKARYMHRDFVEFEPSHTPFLVTNHLPVVSDDPALWARLRVVPFVVEIPEAEQDGHLGEHLLAEADSILTWAVQGWIDYEERGLAEPPAVLLATREYRSESDPLTTFLDDCTLPSPVGRETVSDLWQRWSQWCADEGIPPGRKNALGTELDRRGYERVRGAKGAWFRLGLILLDPEVGGY